MSGFTGERVRDRSVVAQRVLAVTFLLLSALPYGVALVRRVAGSPS